jgi:hypothetical protein
MTIEEILQQALKQGYLAPAMELEVSRICQSATKLSLDEYGALDRLMEALLAGEIGVTPRKQFINVMEELVIGQAMARAAEIEANSQQTLDIGDIAAYALNRLPPLYATTELGAQKQRQRATTELQELIRLQVEEGIDRYLNRPAIPGEPLQQKPLNSLLEQVSSLLRACAPTYES